VSVERRKRRCRIVRGEKRGSCVGGVRKKCQWRGGRCAVVRNRDKRIGREGKGKGVVWAGRGGR